MPDLGVSISLKQIQTGVIGWALWPFTLLLGGEQNSFASRFLLLVVLNKNGSYVALGTARSKQESLVHISSWQRDKAEGMQMERGLEPI